MLAQGADPSRPYARFCRGAALAFALVALYTVVMKAPSGDIERDWLHTLLHVVTGATAAYAGWIATDAARWFTLAILVAYGALGVGGWFTDGLFLESAARIPLDVADNVFHLLLAGASGAVLARRAARARPA